MTIEKLTSDDIGICVNYICEEYELLGGDPKKVSTKMAYAILCKTGWKVVQDGMIIGFAVVENFGGSLLITSLYVNRAYRCGIAVWLLFSKVLEECGDRRLVYIPIHKDMVASKLCNNGVVDKDKAIAWVKKMEGKYGR